MSDGAEVGVDVLAAVHADHRHVDRAARSVLDHNGEGARLTLVCDDVDPDRVLARLPAHHRDRVRVLEHRDGRRSAGGPLNAALDAADAPYVCLLGADDELAPGAIASWYWLAERYAADAVLARVEGGAQPPLPPTRPGRRRALHVVLDRLAHREVPAGLVARAAVERYGLHLDEGVAVGGEHLFLAKLWTAPTIALDRAGPHYRRAVATPSTLPLAEELAFVPRLVRKPFFARRPLSERRARCVVLLRQHVLAVVARGVAASGLSTADRDALARAARALLDAAAGVEAVLSRAERALLDEVLAPEGSPGAAGGQHAGVDEVVTRDLGRVLAREAPLRLRGALALAR